MEIVKLTKQAVSKVITTLNNGGVVVFPTDTVYGFLADAGDKKAVAKIYKIKKRPKKKPLPVFVKDLKMARELAEIDDRQAKIIKQKWPGKYTFILKSKLWEVRHPTIALRIPKYKFLNNLLKEINKPLAQTSVNISGEPALTKISDIIEQFKKYDVLIINAGNLKKSRPSKILDLTKGEIKILRK